MGKLSDEQRRALYGLSARSDEEARLLQHVLQDQTEQVARSQAPDEVDAEIRAKAAERARRFGGKRPIWLSEDGTPHVPSMEDIRASLPSAPQMLSAVVLGIIGAVALGWMAWVFLDALPW